jgi:ubiquinol-cytochrome c reductase subunit 8
VRGCLAQCCSTADDESAALAPNQAKAAPQMVQTYVFNFTRRAWAEAVYIVIPFGIGYGIYSWGKSHDEWLNSKAGHLATGGSGEH